MTPVTLSFASSDFAILNALNSVDHETHNTCSLFIICKNKVALEVKTHNFDSG